MTAVMAAAFGSACAKAPAQQQAPASPQAAEARQVSLAGRIVDEDGHPIANHRLEFNLRWSSSSWSSNQGFEVATDGAGRFRFELVKNITAGWTREVTIGELWNVKEPTLHGSAATIDITELNEPGIHELGDIALQIPGSRKLLRKMSDADLEKLFIEARRGHAFTEDARHDADTCLTEIIERGGPRWEKFIERQLDVARKQQEHDSRPKDEADLIEDVALLTALRRIQHKSDPVVLIVDGEPIIETRFLDDPLIRYQVKNVDPGRETIGLWTYELDDSGMNEYCRIDVRASDSSVVEHFQDRKFTGGGIGAIKVIPPDASATSSVSLKYFVHLPGPGDYQAILHQRHGRASKNFAYSKGPIDGWICSSSDTFTIRVLPREIVLSNVERERLSQRFLAIDLSKPTPLVSHLKRPDDEITGPLDAPQDELYLAGLTAVPVLLDVLDDANSSPRARAWALALLSDVTGVNGPDSDDTKNAAWGRHLSLVYWPGLKGLGYGNTFGWKPKPTGPDEPDIAQQTELMQRWREARKGFVIHE